MTSGRLQESPDVFSLEVTMNDFLQMHYSIEQPLHALSIWLVTIAFSCLLLGGTAVLIAESGDGVAKAQAALMQKQSLKAV